MVVFMHVGRGKRVVSALIITYRIIRSPHRRSQKKKVSSICLQCLSLKWRMKAVSLSSLGFILYQLWLNTTNDNNRGSCSLLVGNLFIISIWKISRNVRPSPALLSLTVENHLVIAWSLSKYVLTHTGASLIREARITVTPVRSNNVDTRAVARTPENIEVLTLVIIWGRLSWSLELCLQRIGSPRDASSKLHKYN